MDLHYQASATTPILVDITREHVRYIQSSTSLPPHLPKFIPIKHCHFRSNHSTAAIYQQRQMIPYHQAAATTPILGVIDLELVKIHLIRCEPSPTPPKIHLEQSSPFWKQPRCLRHPLTTPNDPSPPGYCHHSNSNSCGNCLRTIHPIKCEALPSPSKTTPPSCHNTTISHNEPSLITLSPCPPPP